MHPTLAAALTQTVQFRPMLGVDMHGQTSYGPETLPIRCRYVAPTQARRYQDTRDEQVRPSVTVLVHPDDFDPATVPVGSLCTLPDGDWWPMTAIDAPLYIDGSIHHYRLSV
jgi:hypothetical protein